VAVSYIYSNEYSVSIKGGEFLCLLSDYQILKNFVSWGQWDVLSPYQNTSDIALKRNEELRVYFGSKIELCVYFSNTILLSRHMNKQ
jgi:hypothetical protein